MASMLHGHCSGVLLPMLLVFLLNGAVCLDLHGKNANQSSTGDDKSGPCKAIDGDKSTSTHTAITEDDKRDPWWRLDLLDVYCLKKITILNRNDSRCSDMPQHDCARRLIGAVVSAGLSPNRNSNREIGTVTDEQATSQTPSIDFIANPAVTARYVRVDLPGRNRILHMREVYVEEFTDEDGADEAVDFTLVTSPTLLGSTGNNNATIGAYKSPRDITAAVSFGRQLMIGGANNGLPSSSKELQSNQLGCQLRQIQLPEVGGLDRTGVFYCEATKPGKSATRIQTIILPTDESSVYVRPLQRTKTVNIGDSVRLEMRKVNSPNTDYRWQHNGSDVTLWDKQLSVTIPHVAVTDAGVYSCFPSGHEGQRLHGIMRLVVRECSAEKWGSLSCLNICRRCYNGGVCDANTGTCVCAPGFSGEHCEQVHGRNVFGQNAGHRCSNSGDQHDSACRGRLFCLSDPYGCSCAAGFTGLDCMRGCPDGTYGADCKQTCHCAPGKTCSKDTGECINHECAGQYFGNNCQCSEVEPFSGEVISTLVKKRSLRFSWSEPICVSKQGGSITGYKYRLSAVISGSQTELNHQISAKSALIEDLIPYIEYNFQVAAETSYGTGRYSSGLIVRTKEAKPTVPQNVTIESITEDSITLAWLEPDPPHGNITAYNVAWRHVGETQEEKYVNTTVTHHRMSGLQLSEKYSVKVRAKTKVGLGDWSENISATVVGVPGPLRNLRWTNRTKETVTLDWDPPSQPKGPISGYVVKFRATEKEDFIKRETESAPFVETNLEPGTKYEFNIFAKNWWYTGTPSILEVYTISAKETRQNNSTGLAVGMVFLVLALVTTVLVAIIIFRRKANQPQRTSDGRRSLMFPTDRPHELKVDEPVMATSSNAYCDSEGGSSPPTPLGSPKLAPKPSQKQVFKQPPPVCSEALADYTKMKESMKESGFEADYKTIPDGQLHPWTVARKPENKHKNRFANVIAYDHSRVVLTPMEGDPHSDYINACYVDGYKEADKYIASQGPNKGSLNDIWRMVWQLNVDKIVMLTNPVENGKVKCLQYWPNTGSCTYADISVVIVDERVFLDHTIRLLKITQHDSDEDCRVVKQFHYTTWPDMKPPEYPAPLLNFIRVVNSEQNEGRILIHCSAGVGRTGTYICLDSMLQQMNQEGQVDVLGFIYRMRQKRIMMVQTPEQYQFIFDALLAASLTGETTYKIVDFRRQLTAMKKVQGRSKETGIEKQFQALGKLRLGRRNERSRSGHLPENATRNRFPDFIPTDRSRPFLVTTSREDDNNYINATFLPGYRKKCRYITTQMPMPSTAADIWRLMYDQKATCIVMLNPLDEDDESICRYWPEDGPFELGPLVVELLQTKQYKGVIGRTFSLRHVRAKAEPARTVCQFQCQDWPADEEVPSSRQGILTLMDLTQQWHEEKSPIVVHCMNGFGRSAVYCALMSAMEQFQEEKVVDVFQAVLRLRAVNSSMMYSMTE
ncbi:receptor-type tyrosine-protein phosphatase T-like isoform X2 [Acanthaster planci]|uniref:protein-tyrosine-phosphatase n=1 Tax=Acanthaster planci TaxID=133434 RepID=A0A8B7Z9W4_ACAPL|nr:receptor-type tyrosine-protein phosphatase T-like isoform X2 [Acanthaster planci]